MYQICVVIERKLQPILGLFVKKWQPRVGLAEYDILFAYLFVVEVKSKTYGETHKMEYICFSPVLLKVFFDRKAITFSLNKENQATIFRGNSKRVVTWIPLHESGFLMPLEVFVRKWELKLCLAGYDTPAWYRRLSAYLIVIKKL